MARVEVVLKGGHAQVEDRYIGYLSDQHGRTWTGIFSKKSGDPSDYPTPTRWTAPLSPQFLRGLFVPPSQYRKIDRPEAKAASVLIDYDAWMTDLQAAQAHHDQTKVDVINHQAQGFDAIRLMEDPPASLLNIIGPGPFPPIEVVEEMSAGDAWALGQSDVIPSWFTEALQKQIVHTARQTGLFQTWQLRELTKAERVERKRKMGRPAIDITAQTTWPEFLKSASAMGKSRAEASEDWKVHKDSLSAASL